MTLYVFDRGSIYGEAEIFSDLDPNGLLSPEEYDKFREDYGNAITDRLERYDGRFWWQPETSEIFGVVGETEDLDGDAFREWWERMVGEEYERLCNR